MFTPKFVEARFSPVEDVLELLNVPGDDDDLHRAENRLRRTNLGALRSALHCPTTDSIIGSSFFEDYSFSTMADDEYRVGDREPPPIVRAAWEVARSSGMLIALADYGGELLSERHRLSFVDYLRLCFRCGGFPGYDGAAEVPAELEMLSAGLVELCATRSLVSRVGCNGNDSDPLIPRYTPATRRLYSTSAASSRSCAVVSPGTLCDGWM